MQSRFDQSIAPHLLHRKRREGGRLQWVFLCVCCAFIIIIITGAAWRSGGEGEQTNKIKASADTINDHVCNPFSISRLWLTCFYFFVCFVPLILQLVLFGRVVCAVVGYSSAGGLIPIRQPSQKKRRKEDDEGGTAAQGSYSLSLSR